MNHVPGLPLFSASPVTCDHNSTIFPKMKCTFCTNYSQHFLAKTRLATQVFLQISPSCHVPFSFFPEILGFVSLSTGFWAVSSLSFLKNPGGPRHFLSRRFAQLPFLLS
ncbi:MAG TPA: hypothetical protein H9844_08015 [Candidatus Evtepia faecigallinarum]|nr:hypothetical protein [Candidatus Evtepia faecigallinarum]